jgi:hypothetical protein
MNPEDYTLRSGRFAARKKIPPGKGNWRGETSGLEPGARPAYFGFLAPCCSRAQGSFRVTVRLNTGAPGVESLGST